MALAVHHSCLNIVNGFVDLLGDYLPYLKYMSISSALILEVMAIIGMVVLISRMQTVADTPSR